MPISIDQVNALDRAAFVAAFADIAEHAPWVAEGAADARPYRDRAAMIDAFDQAMRAAEPESRLALIRAHPDLAGRAAIAGDLTEDSKREQAGAGLDRLTEDEFTRFTALNDRYKSRFGFPFILAVKGATKDTILAAFEARVGNDPQSELETALDQVSRIIRFRLQDRVADDLPEGGQR